MKAFKRLLKHGIAFGGIAILILLVVLFVGIRPAQTHSSPVIDGLFTGDWCAPNHVGLYGPDSLTVLAPPACNLGIEFFWDDWDSTFGPPDTMGWLLGGVVGAPVPDPEVDIDFFATTADLNRVFFVIVLGPFPSTGGTPPHVQIAIDLNGPLSGLPAWYDPLPAGTGGLGLAAVPQPLFPEYLITTDVAAGTAFVWQSITVPGAWTLIGPAPLAWSGMAGPGPSVIEIMAPWPMFAPGPPIGPGIPLAMTVMSAHSAPFVGLADAPMTPEEDVFSEIGAGFTTSPDVCPPAPFSTNCELFLGPGGGAGSADGFILITYPFPPTPTPTHTETPTATSTHTPPPPTPQTSVL